MEIKIACLILSLLYVITDKSLSSFITMCQAIVLDKEKEKPEGLLTQKFLFDIF